ncbi:MAG: DNA-formamidopyrimidine glycosylase family protein [Candidatus Bipolaricaulota bacterium]
MPELPELEVLKEVLERRVVGREIGMVRILRPGVLSMGGVPVEALNGNLFSEVSRRGKHLVLSAGRDLHMVIHLMTAGRLIICRGNTRATKATSLIVAFSDGKDLRLVENGPVKLVQVHMVKDPLQVKRIAQQGIEPLSSALTTVALNDMVAKRRRQAKRLLTDQQMIAGIGSTYADEILFDAKISPVRYVNTLCSMEIEQLRRSITKVLENAIEQIRIRIGDSLFTDEVRDFMRVYKRTGQACLVCGTKIAEIRYANTRTYYCARCQGSRKNTLH